MTPIGRSALASSLSFISIQPEPIPVPMTISISIVPKRLHHGSQYRPFGG